MEDIIHLAITMTEMDTGIELSLDEREEMVNRIKARVEDINRYWDVSLRLRCICSIPPNFKLGYNRLMGILMDMIFAVIVSVGILMLINKIWLTNLPNFAILSGCSVLSVGIN